MNKRLSFELLLAVVLCGLSFSACGKLLGTKISEDKFVSYYVDFLAAQDSLGKDPVTTGKILTSLNKKYDVTQAQYDNTIKYYSENPEDWERFFGKVIAVAQQRRTGH
jgi:hypothetical protein